jgi:hypothetical protein
MSAEPFLKIAQNKGLLTGIRLQASLYVCSGPVGLAAAPHQLLYWRWGYCAQPSRSKSYCKQAAPLQAGARSTRRGFRVGVIVSLEKSFVRGIKARIACTVAGSKRYGLQHLSDEGAISRGIFYVELYLRITFKIGRAATFAE